MLGEKVRGFDRDFLRALAGASAKGKVVLGEVLGDRPIMPSPGQRIAVRQQQNIRPLNDHTDSDDVVRRLPLTFTIDGAKMPTMAVELAARALGDRASIRRARKDDACGLPGSGPGAEHDDAEFRRRRRRHPDLLVCRSACVRRQERQGLFPALVRRQGRHLRYRSRHRGSPNDVQALCDRHRGRACPALRSRKHAGHRRLADQHDRRRLCPCHRGQQPDRAQRGGRTRTAGTLVDRGPDRCARRCRRLAVQARSSRSLPGQP